MTLKPKQTQANEWQKLRSRYESKSSFRRRRVLRNLNDLPDFQNFIVDKGADVFAKPCQDELLRFNCNGVFGIVWTTGTGNLLAHDFSDAYYQGVQQ